MDWNWIIWDMTSKVNPIFQNYLMKFLQLKLNLKKNLES